MKFDGVLFCSDLDGTLLRTDKSISQKNLEAIEYFKANGGTFTIMTGRMPYAMGNIIGAVNPNAPIGFGNGLGIYDSKTNEKHCLSYVDSSVMEIVKKVYELFPAVGIELTTHDCIYTVRANDTVLKHFEDENHELIQVDANDFSLPIAKIVFAAKEYELESFISEIKKWQMEKFRLIRSDDLYFEILPKTAGKECLLENLKNLLADKVKKTIAIGDNDNDAKMLALADFGIAVENASEKAKASADLITVNNENDAIAKVIYDLDKISI